MNIKYLYKNGRWTKSASAYEAISKLLPEIEEHVRKVRDP